MKCRFLILLMLLVILAISCSPKLETEQHLAGENVNNIVVRKDFKRYFDSCSVEGSIALYDYTNQKWIVSDTIGIHYATLPASSFKIINLLIALETKTISDENEVVNWVRTTDTVKYGYRPEIYHDMTVKEAFKISAGWVFVELAKKIGRENYKQYLNKSNYGNVNLSQEDTDFWNFGKFAISPKNQVEFIKNLYEENLPFSKRNIEIVKKVMITEQNEDYTLRAKTGWTRDNNINTGWWVGYIETQKGTYIFATRLLQDRKFKRDDFGTCRMEITKKIFKDLGIIKGG